MPVFSVSQVASHLRQTIESDPLLSDLWVAGEVSNLRVSASGHSYFTLKDEQSVLNCVMFRGQPGTQVLANGGSVSAHGRIAFYPPRGTADFMVDLAMPQGVGELALELERLKLRLEAEGLFEASRKRGLPLFPRVVAVVTSPSGAVFHDIENVVRRRFPLAELVLSPTPVQGADAAPQIAAALKRIDRDGRADVTIIARGGGSLEDLWPFNDEQVARAIYASRAPVVSAIGHETDFTIADLVSDLRAPTPSAAAELAVPDRHDLRRRVYQLGESSRRGVTHQLDSRRAGVAGLLRRLESGLPNLETWTRRVDDLARSVSAATYARLTLERSRIDGLERRLDALDPASTLARGFSVVENLASGVVVTSTAHAAPGDPLTITVSDGSVPAVAGANRGSNGSRRRRKPSDDTKPEPPLMKRLL